MVSGLSKPTGDREVLERTVPLQVSTVFTLLELFMNLHIINECPDDYER